MNPHNIKEENLRKDATNPEILELEATWL